MKRFIYCAATALSVTFLVHGSASAATIYKIDIDVEDGDDNVHTEDGWTSLNATNNNGSSVTVDGVKFEIASSDGTRLRTSSGLPTPNDLTADFAFDDGGNVLLLFGDAGDLQAGTWQVEIYSWDGGGGSALDPQHVSYRTDGAATLVSTTAIAHPTDPMITFTFESNGTSDYDIFLGGGNQTRLNAVQLTLIPEPSSFLLAAIGLIGFVFCSRKRMVRK